MGSAARRGQSRQVDEWLRGFGDAAGVTKGRAVLTCTFPDLFVPNPGGQQKVDGLIGLRSPLDTPIRTLWARGGVGAGKSFIGAAFICSGAKADPNSRSLITANSYGQLETSTLVALAEFCKLFNVPLSPVADVPIDSPEWADETARKIAHRRLCTIFGAPVLVLSATAFTGTTDKAQESGRGLQIRRYWADEFAYADASAFNTLNTRLGRGMSGGLKGLGLITSSINKNSPYNWIYDLFDAPNRTENQRQKFVSVAIPTQENRHLDSDYIESQAAALTDELYKIEILGEYAVTSIGKVFNTFNRDLHVLYGSSSALCRHAPQSPLHVSLDFNHSPACAIAAHYDHINKELRVVREWYLTDSDTFQLSEEIAQWITSNQSQSKVFVYGDASGNQRTANSRQTNWQIVWATLRRYGIHGVKRYGLSNPSIVDSVNSVKLAFKSDSIFLNGESCQELIKDLESLAWAKNNQIDKSDLKRSHLADTLRYLVDSLMPYRGFKVSRSKNTDLVGVPL